MVTCASSPITTSISGAPKRPRASTSHPRRASTAWRAAASAVKFAIMQPVVKPTLASRGSRRTSSSQPAATSSATEFEGALT